MATQTSERAGVFSFQVGRNDLGPLVVDAVGLECDAYSPLAPLLASYRRGAGTPSAEAARIAADPTAAKALRILARPTFRMVNHTGGGSLPASYFTACGSLVVDKQAVAVLNPSYEGASLIQIFDRPHAFLAWWLILNATQASEPMANYLPPPIRFESLVYLLHAVDAFRRGAYRSLLDYRPTDRPSISPSEFAESMRESLRTRDLRWLMPACLSLTPNLNTVALEDGPQFAEALARYDFLAPVRDGRTGDAMLLFGEAGGIMGVEFYRTWFQSVGFETTVRTSAGWRVMHRGFLAPTALSNHLFLFEKGADSTCMVNHQAMTREALDARLAALLTEAVEFREEKGRALPAEVAAPLARPAAPVPAGAFAPGAGIRCPACRAQVPEGSQFCNRCGARLGAPPAPAKPSAAATRAARPAAQETPRTAPRETKKTPAPPPAPPPAPTPAKPAQKKAAPAPVQPKPAPARAAPAPTKAPLPRPPAAAPAVCAACGVPLKAGARFCTGCGATVGTGAKGGAKAPALPAACPQCGAPRAEGVAFCTQCGTRLA